MRNSLCVGSKSQVFVQVLKALANLLAHVILSANLEVGGRVGRMRKVKRFAQDHTA